MANNSKENKEVKVTQLDKFISYDLLKKLKEKEPETKFILPNGKEAVLDDKTKKTSK